MIIHTIPTRPFAERHARDRRTLLPGDRPLARALMWWTVIVFVLGIVCGLLMAECIGQNAWAGEATPPVCGVSCRWQPETAERTRMAWPEIRAAAVVEGVEAPLLAALVAWESTTLPVRGGLGGRMRGPAQVDPAVWLSVLRERHGAPGLIADDLDGMLWGLAAGALALRHSLAVAGGRVEMGLCAYAHGMKALAWDDCPYARAVLAVRDLVRRDLDDLIEERT